MLLPPNTQNGTLTGRPRGDVHPVKRYLGSVKRDTRLTNPLICSTVTPPHGNASMQVFPHSDSSGRFVWILDVQPDELATAMA